MAATFALPALPAPANVTSVGWLLAAQATIIDPGKNPGLVGKSPPELLGITAPNRSYLSGVHTGRRAVVR